jgi:hypothetical protein
MDENGFDESGFGVLVRGKRGLFAGGMGKERVEAG